MSRRDNATSAQAMLIARMAESHVFTDVEKDQLARELADGMTKARASALIERMKDVIAERKATEEEAANA